MSGVFASRGTSAEAPVNGSEDLKENKGGKETAERAALSKAFSLEEGVISAMGCFVPYGVVMVVEIVEERDE